MDAGDPRVRVDKWLWAARFYKTRSLAADAVEGGRVQVNGARAKPSRELKVGDALVIRTGDVACEIEVRGLAVQRGPAQVARTLYEERPESIARRAAAAAARREHADPARELHGRPTKRDRRLIRRFTGD
jgi:ribosome-associated heat shock protein Hsp15